MLAEFYSKKEGVNHELIVIGDTFSPGLAKALWDYNLEQLKPTFLGMVKFPAVEGIKLENEWGKLVGASGRITDDEGQVVDIIGNGQEKVLGYTGLFHHAFPIIHLKKGNPIVVGEATIYSSTKVVFDKVKLGFSFIIINAIIKTIALWILFIAVSRKLLSRPLAVLTEATAQINFDKLDNLKIAIGIKGRNELKILEEAFNSMIQKLIRAKNEITNKADQLTERNNELSMMSTDLELSNHRLTTILDNTKALALVGDKKSAMLLATNTMLQEIPFLHQVELQIAYKDTDADHNEGFVSFCPTFLGDSIAEVIPEVNTMYRSGSVFTLKLPDKLALHVESKMKTGSILVETQLYVIIRHEKQLQGVILLQNIDRKVITNEHLAFIDTLAHFLSVTIEKIEMHIGLEQKINERTYELSDAFKKLDKQHSELKSTQQQLVQSEKMASLGTLTAGVAHEINNPTSFAYAAVYMMENEIEEIKSFLVQLAGGDSADPEVLKSFDDKFLKMVELIVTAKEGTTRIKTIVEDLRAFARLDDAKQDLVHVSELINSTIHLVRTKYDSVLLEAQFDYEPLFKCFPSKLNQVFMNIIVNACQAIESKKLCGGKLKGKVIIKTVQHDNQLIITFEDNGCGMTEQTVNRIFEPFFTTKDVGSGTGLGMAISFGIIKEHGGNIYVESVVDEGTKIIINIDV